MKIGFTSIYSWRPHVEHTWFLSLLAKQMGYETCFLTCDANLKNCYTHLLRDRSRYRECAQCQIGGIRSYANSNIASIGDLVDSACQNENADQWARSSASTLGRFESPEDYLSSDFFSLTDRLKPEVSKVYQATCNWIAREKLSAICLFNGRIDVTRAMFEAAKFMKIPVITHERTWFGDGIQLLLNEHCLGLSSVKRMVGDWKDKALTAEQASKAASLIAKRFIKKNDTEWRAYNLLAVNKEWPVQGKQRRFLILPSSMNETWGHSDWASGWASPLQAIEAVIAYLGLQKNELLLRCHPNWSEKIGKHDGRLPEQYYRQWAQEKGIDCIASRENTSTLHLIEQCDAVIVSVGSAALEAGLLGKIVIALSPSNYHAAGFTYDVHAPDQLEALNPLLHQGEKLNSQNIARQTLRFVYTVAYRIPQYVNYIKAKNATQYQYFAGADPQRFADLLNGKALSADDANFEAVGCAGEEAILKQIEQRNWLSLASTKRVANDLKRMTVKRRIIFQFVDKLRNLSDVGSR